MHIYGHVVLRIEVKMFKEQPSSLTAKRADLLLADGDTFATIDFKSGDGYFVAHWLVSGLDIHGLPAMILELSVPMSSQTHESLVPEALAFGSTFVLPMATHLATTTGVGSKIKPLSVSERAAFFEHHMSYQFSQDRAGNLPGHQKTVCLSSRWRHILECLLHSSRSQSLWVFE